MTGARDRRTPVRAYDYIIVGAGSAGCVLAYRLSENSSTSVLLIESGPDDSSPLIHMPQGYRRLRRDRRLVSRFPVTADATRGEWQGSLMSGRVLGGTSAINSMLYARGQPRDYDEWASGGAPGWSWPDLAPCFKKIEDHVLGESATRGAGGPLHVSIPRCGDPVCEAFIDAGVAMGLPRKSDLNEPDQEGIGYFPATIRGGRRVSAAQAFVAPIRRRPNLTIATATTTTKIVFEGTCAVGVSSLTPGGRVEVRAVRDIIVCAGALQSPKLLQLSGIGPAGLLRSLGVPVVRDSPGVGANLRDHWGLRFEHRLARSAAHDHRPRGLRRRLETLRYFIFQSGILSLAAADIGAFVRTRPETDRPDAELQVAPDTDLPAIGREPGLRCTVRSLRPESQGFVAIRSADPAARPEIRGNFLSAEADRDLTVAMIHYVRRLLRQPALRPYLKEESFPGPDCRSADEILDVCRRFGSPGSHFAGTCKMGQDRMAVLDEKLRVRGVSGLRVVDGSIMPTLVSGNTNGPIMAVAWRAADLILQETRQP